MSIFVWLGSFIFALILAIIAARIGNRIEAKRQWREWIKKVEYNRLISKHAV